ncbi:sialidase family protein [Limihaloglobus sulfuriphilus]|uniref:sialidase family protein n=1 Tax=Limihaloglobus sulfuriphilus TaxID=1851148 RepID=UPI0011BA6A59|nr:sialidase family protein [Limihaloglobus sulfuriphilus]
MRIHRFFIGKYESPDALVKIEPVVIPWGDELKGNNWHLGWPVAVLVNETIIVVYHRNPQHTPRFGVKKYKDQFHSTAIVTRSTDYGKTWTSSVDIRSFVKTPTEDCMLAFGNSIGTADDGTVVLVTAYGVFRSQDEGASWRHLPDSYTSRTLSGNKCNNGPVIVNHPEKGLVSFSHNKNREIITIRTSRDTGENWHQHIIKIPEWAAAIEPTGLYHDGSLFILARAHGKDSFQPETKTWRYIQLVSPEGWLPLMPAYTNITTTDITDEIPIEGYGPWSQDTVSLDLNPVSHRIEAVCTNRCGGGEGKEQQRMQMTLNLWSIDPREFKEGKSKWRFEGTLIKHAGTMTTGADGMHPGASVIDTKNNVQRIYVYLGEHLGPAGIFSVTRSLDTAALREWLKEN